MFNYMNIGSTVKRTRLASQRGSIYACTPVAPQTTRLHASLVFGPAHIRAVWCKSAAASGTATSSLITKRIFDQVDALEADAQAQGAGGRTTYAAFQAAEEQWARLRGEPPTGPAPQFVRESTQPLQAVPDYDVVVCGGTLGIFVAASLARRGLRVVVLERGPLRGRAQEWNISRKELLELEHVGVATREELEACVAIEFNPVRVGFAWMPENGGASGGTKLTEVWTRDVLNLGVRPNALVGLMRQKLEELGGVVLERSALVRWATKPDGVCLVVGTLGSGFANNSTADVILTNTPLQPNDANFNLAQYFWEAFPAASGPTDRTTYMFTYLTADSYRPPLAAMLEDYWRLMPQYQGVELEDITFKRVLFGFFPTFKDTPLRPTFDRVIQVGDASGLQSPLSFGGFGALTRHLARLTTALAEAVETDALDRESLALVHAYNPGLSSSWMMQKAMSVRKGEQPPPDLINRMLAGNFKAMERLGDPVMKPFLQDVIKFGPMMRTMTAQMLTDPLSIPGLISHVGPMPLLEWLGHMTNLAAYTALNGVASAVDLRNKAASASFLTPRERFALNRLLDAWEYGSGQDYKL
ncbi:hypothetical protein Vafri_6207 [Volvox africanus]|uniref:Uncharacterized protein n=1 Tax=Volvox africanus TaxID=51714 RepID=A0A8J4AYM3_9CHLO|nr:hypothetical protein Vafri_6207 [Volvox africanus]